MFNPLISGPISANFITFSGSRASCIAQDGTVYTATSYNIAPYYGAIQLWKSTDNGQTYQAISNSSSGTSAGSATATANNINITAAPDGKIHCFWVDSVATVVIRYKVYNPFSNTWSTSNGSIDGGSMTRLRGAVIDTNGGIHVVININESGGDFTSWRLRHLYKSSETLENWTLTPSLPPIYNTTSGITALSNGQIAVFSVFNGLAVIKMWTSGVWSSDFQVDNQVMADIVSITSNNLGQVELLYRRSETLQNTYTRIWDGSSLSAALVVQRGETDGSKALSDGHLYTDLNTNDTYIVYKGQYQEIWMNKKPYGGVWGTPIQMHPGYIYSSKVSIPTNGFAPYLPVFISDIYQQYVFYDRIFVHNKIPYRTLKVNTTKGILNIPVYPPDVSLLANKQLRIKIDNTFEYGLIETGLITDAKASPLRIRTNQGTRALLK
ncbi:hypothetical protein [Paenibacillus luteus]|uniref:hypothetical protein n=1 Tax=Paenibacillus luteus TaxID=2545753 RepID=UPI001142A9BC|nr:hypothetical protein [Paenibacillus luteus]